MRALLVALLVVAPAAACELPGGDAQKIQATRYLVLYRTQPAALKVGRHFALEFAVCPTPQSVRVDAWMPEHRHGMNYRPTVTATGEGRYKAEGLMLHMAGKWELVFELRAKDSVERVAQVIRLE
jgi:YtkA-like protein